MNKTTSFIPPTQFFELFENDLADGQTSTISFTATSTSTALIIQPLLTTGSHTFSIDTVGFAPKSVYEAVVIMKSDYYPFGMQMPGRQLNTGDYRFGYQGSEKDPEMKGEGNSYTTEFRQYDPRIARWLSIDPVFQPWQSPYTSMDNNPICKTDPLGNVASGDKKPKRYNNPDKASEKYCKKKGYNSSNSSRWRREDGGVVLSVAIEDYDPADAEVYGAGSTGIATGSSSKTFAPTKWATRRYKAKREAEFEADRKREYNNTHSIMSNVYKPNASLTNRPFYTDVNNVSYDEWMKNRTKIATFEKGMQQYMLAMATLATGGSGSLLRTATVNGVVNLSGQLIANEGNFKKVDALSVAISFLGGLVPGSSTSTIVTTNLTTSALDATMDYSVDDGFRTVVGKNSKNPSVILCDFGFNVAGNMGASSFGKNPFFYEVVGTSVTGLPTQIMNTAADKQLE